MCSAHSPWKCFLNSHAGVPRNSSSKSFVLHREAKIASEVHSIIFISKKTDVHPTKPSSANAAITNHSQQDREWADTGYIHLVSIQNCLSSSWIRVCTGIWLEGFSFPFTESLWPHISFFPALCRVMIPEQDTSRRDQGYLLQRPEKQFGSMFPCSAVDKPLTE